MQTAFGMKSPGTEGRSSNRPQPWEVIHPVKLMEARILPTSLLFRLLHFPHRPRLAENQGPSGAAETGPVQELYRRLLMMILTGSKRCLHMRQKFNDCQLLWLSLGTSVMINKNTCIAIQSAAWNIWDLMWINLTVIHKWWIYKYDNTALVLHFQANCHDYMARYVVFKNFQEISWSGHQLCTATNVSLLIHLLILGTLEIIFSASSWSSISY